MGACTFPFDDYVPRAGANGDGGTGGDGGVGGVGAAGGVGGAVGGGGSSDGGAGAGGIGGNSGGGDSSGTGGVGGGVGGAGGGEVVSVTFGERSMSDVQGVTTDAFIEGSSPTSNHGSSATVRVEGTPIRTGLLRFDVSSIPPFSTVRFAEVMLSTATQGDAGSTDTTQLFEIFEPWVEASVTYAMRTASDAWTSVGCGPGSRSTTVLATLTPPMVATAYDVTLPNDVVQRWIDDPGDNHGLALVSAGGGDATHYGSSENNDPTLRPQLLVEYEQ